MAKDDLGWKTKKRKERKENAKGQKKAEKPQKPRIRPAALLISAKDERSYADILKKVKEAALQEDAEDNFEKVRRTASGQLLIVLNRKARNGMGAIHRKMAETLAEDATVSCKTHEVDLQIRDIEKTTTRAEILAALQKTIGDDGVVGADSVKALRGGYGGTQTARVKLPIEAARKVTADRGRIRIGLVNCRVREIDQPLKCFKCWNIGHIATQCKSQIDRSKLCMKCGGSGHKIAECNKEAFCILCKETRNEDQCKHIAGSYKCTAYQVDIRKTARNRR